LGAIVANGPGLLLYTDVTNTTAKNGFIDGRIGTTNLIAMAQLNNTFAPFVSLTVNSNQDTGNDQGVLCIGGCVGMATGYNPLCAPTYYYHYLTSSLENTVETGSMYINNGTGHVVYNSALTVVTITDSIVMPTATLTAFLGDLSSIATAATPTFDATVNRWHADCAAGYADVVFIIGSSGTDACSIAVTLTVNDYRLNDLTNGNCYFAFTDYNYHQTLSGTAIDTIYLGTAFFTQSLLSYSQFPDGSRTLGIATKPTNCYYDLTSCGQCDSMA